MYYVTCSSIIAVIAVITKLSEYDSYRLEEPIIKYSMGQKNGLRAFGYNSTESEPIWIKSGTM